MTDPQIIALHGTAMSVVLERAGNDAPVWRHWGARIASMPLPLADGRSRTTFALDIDQPPAVVPTFGNGGFGPSALLAHRDGCDFVQQFDTSDIEPTVNGVTIHLHDSVARLTLEQSLTIDPASDVLTLSARLTNTGDTPLDLLWLAAGTLPLAPDSAAIHSFTGRHNAEFVATIEPMPKQRWRRENRRGLTGHAGPPGVFVATDGATMHQGAVFAAQLAWSGNHLIEVARSDDGDWTLMLGEWLAPGEIRLAPGESYRTPDVLATWSVAGHNGATQNFHAAVRARGPWAKGQMPPRKVHINSWEGFYFDHDAAQVMALADRAAALGVERFVLDDGWFKGRCDDRRALGDWTPDPVKYPDGLGPLAAHVSGLGMDFGLWVEPEMVNSDSDLYRAHPEWALAIDGRTPPTARHQLVLDLGREAVRDHLFAALDRLLTDLPIAYLKWDHNRDLAPAGGGDGRAGYHAQVLGTYALIDRLRTAHPDVEIEACAGGGGRIDAGIATRTHRFWTSDNIDAVSRTDIQRGYLAFMPPERMGSHVGTTPAHATGRSQSMAFRCATALTGHFGVELDPATLSTTDAATLTEWMGHYKALRETLHNGRVWRGSGCDGLLWQAHGEPSDMVLLVTRLAPPTLGRPQPLRLPMLADVASLRVTLLAVAAATIRTPHQMPLFAAMRDEGVDFGGDWLANVGLPIPALQGESAALFQLRR